MQPLTHVTKTATATVENKAFSRAIKQALGSRMPLRIIYRRGIVPLQSKMCKPGSFVRYEGKNGETILWPSYPYTDVLIPVLHHGAIGSGVDKFDLCRFDLDTSVCRRGARCTYAHGWSDRVEWICPVCTQVRKIACESKWQHILKYQHVGVFVVDDGRTVANYLDYSS